MGEIIPIELNQLPERRRMSDRVAEDLFRLIVTLQYRPGQILNETWLMQQLDCGRTPLREALIVLEGQKLIRVVPRQATLVTEISIDAASEVYEALRYVEGPLARLAAERNTLTDLAELDDLARALESFDSARGLPPNGVYRLAGADFGFHMAMARAARNQFMLATLEALRGPAMRLLCLSYRQGSDETLRDLSGEHRAVLEALKDRNPDAAEAAVQAHADSAKRRMFESFGRI